MAIKRILAALCFFTRLPFWRLANIDRKYYERVVPLWPLAGWLTGGIMAVTFLLTSMFLPLNISILLTILSRVLVTGALHEDGFADFCDGFGGGNGRERILAIMKDSHIGTYGVLGLVIYYLLFYTTLTDIAATVNDSIAMAWMIVSVDTMAKYISSTVIYSLPYARKETEAKNRLIYTDTPFREKVLSLLLGAMPLVLFMVLYCCPPCYEVNIQHVVTIVSPILAAVIVKALLVRWMKKCIQGYTGDCCGATFIITEMTIYLTLPLNLMNPLIPLIPLTPLNPLNL